MVSLLLNFTTSKTPHTLRQSKALGNIKGNPVGLSELPENLPVPLDDGAANHLEGTSWPDVSFNSTNQEKTNLKELGGNIGVKFP